MLRSLSTGGWVLVSGLQSVCTVPIPEKIYRHNYTPLAAIIRENQNSLP